MVLDWARKSLLQTRHDVATSGGHYPALLSLPFSPQRRFHEKEHVELRAGILLVYWYPSIMSFRNDASHHKVPFLGERLFSPQAGMQSDSPPSLLSGELFIAWTEGGFLSRSVLGEATSPLSSPYSCYVQPLFRESVSRLRAACVGNVVVMVLDWARKSLLQTRHDVATSGGPTRLFLAYLSPPKGVSTRRRTLS